MVGDAAGVKAGGERREGLPVLCSAALPRMGAGYKTVSSAHVHYQWVGVDSSGVEEPA